MKYLFKVVVVLALLCVNSAWAFYCVPDTISGNPLCIPPDDGGDYNNSNGYTPPKVIHLPDSWGAVANDSVTGSYGYASNQPSRSAAKKAALKDCNSSGCKTIGVYANTCMSLVWGGGVIRPVTDDNKAIAERMAMSACSEKANNCQILVSECSLPRGY